MLLEEIIISPVLTEKTAYMGNERKYVFWVHRSANKPLVKKAVEKIFNVKVDKVNIINVKGKFRRVRYRGGYTPSRKKAVVTLKEGYSINLYKEK